MKSFQSPEPSGLGLGLVVVSLSFLFASGCTFQPGSAFGTLDATFDARWVVSAAQQVDAWVTLEDGYQVKLTGARAEVGEIQLLGHHHDEVAESEHEHEDSEDSEDEETAPVVHLHVDPAQELDLLVGQAVALTCGGSCDLPLTHVTQARAQMTSLRFEGWVRDTQIPARIAGEVAWTLEAEPGAALVAEMDLPVGRDEPPAIDLQLDLHPTPALFEGQDWTAPHLNDLPLRAHVTRAFTP